MEELELQVQSLTEQLEELYHEKTEFLESVGVTDFTEVTAMIENLEAQLNDLYSNKG